MRVSVARERLSLLKAFLKAMLCVVLVVSLMPPITGAYADEPTDAVGTEVVDADGSDAVSDETGDADTDDSDSNEAEGSADYENGEAGDATVDGSDEAGVEDESGEDVDEGSVEGDEQNVDGESDENIDEASEEGVDEGAVDESGETTEEGLDEEAGEDATEEGAEEESEDATEEESEDAEPVVLEAENDDIAATLTVDPTVELPEGATLVVTSLVSHDAEEAEAESDDEQLDGQEDAVDEESAADEEGTDEGTADEEGAEKGASDEAATDEESTDDESAVGEEAADGDQNDESAESDDEATDEEVTDESGDEATDDENMEGEEPEEAADEPEASTTVTGAQATIDGMQKAVKKYLADEKSDKELGEVADAYAVEVLDGDGMLLPIDDEAATLAVTFKDAEKAADYADMYAIARKQAKDDATDEEKAAMAAPISTAADLEFDSEDEAAKAVVFKGKAIDVSKELQTALDEDETTIELAGVQSIYATQEASEPEEEAADEPEATDEENAVDEKPVAKRATAKKANDELKDAETDELADSVADSAKPKLGGPLKVPATDSRPKKATVDTNALGITLNLFDYEAVDVNSQNTYNGPTSYSGINEGRNKSNQLMFFASGSANRPNVDQNNLNQFTGENWSQNAWTEQYANQGIVQSRLSGTRADDYADRYPLLNTSASDKTTDYLFAPADVSGKKTVYENVNNLFYLKNNGTVDEKLVYDSNEAYAYYDVDQANAKDGGKFTVYDGTFDRANAGDDGMKVGFFPFDLPKDEWWNGSNPPEINATRATPPVNHHLGLTMNVGLTMPYNGTINYANGQAPMTFEFSGDDDMWIFVDGKLVLDVGGIHQPVRGTINFKTGVIELSSGTAVPKSQSSYAYTAASINSPTAEDLLVRGNKVYLWNVYGGTDDNPVFENNGGTPAHRGIFGDHDTAAWRAGSEHTLQAFYLERGGCDSNLKISTNIHLMTKRKATAEKEWSQDAEDSDKQPVQVQLIRKATARDNGELVGYAVVDTKTLDSDGDWTNTWDDLATEGYNPTGIYYDGKGEYSGTNIEGNRYCDYTYMFREVPMAGVVPSYSSTEGDIETESVGEMDKVGVELSSKQASGSTTATLNRTQQERGTSTSSDDGSYAGPSVTLEEADNWRYGIGDLDAYKTEGSGDNTKYYDFTYDYAPHNNDVTMVQSQYRLGAAPSDAPKSAAAVPADFSKVTITNTPIYLDVEKVWETANGTPENPVGQHDAVWVQLYKQTRANSNSEWGAAEPVGNAVQLTSGKDWHHKFKVALEDNVRYFVKEGTAANDGTNFQAKEMFTNNGKDYVHDYTAYDRDYTIANETQNDIQFASSEGPAQKLNYAWETAGTGDNATITRTFANQTELKQQGGAAKKFAEDTIKVQLSIPATAAHIPNGSNADYTATIALPEALAPLMSGEEGSEEWNTTVNGLSGDSSVTKNVGAKTVAVTVPAANAKANAGKTFTISIPVKPSSGDNLATISSADVTVHETEYQVPVAAGQSVNVQNDPTGSEFVEMPAGTTHADAKIANKPVVTKVTVEKKWSGDEPKSGSVWVLLKKGGSAASVDNGDSNPVELNASNHWTHTFENLDPASGQYTVEEGTYNNSTFTKFGDRFTLSNEEGATVYRQVSIVYYDADGNKRETVENEGTEDETRTPIENLESGIAPDCGKAVITNGPLGANIKLQKVDADAEDPEDNGLVGAKFQLFKDAGEQASGQPAVWNKTQDTERVPDADTEFTTGDDGTVDLPTLLPGTYWLLETSAPAGYLVRDADHPIQIVVDNTGKPIVVTDQAYDTERSKATMTDTPTEGVYTLTAKNFRAWGLPAADGIGIMEFLFIGAFLMSLAAGLYIRRKRGLDMGF